MAVGLGGNAKRRKGKRPRVAVTAMALAFHIREPYELRPYNYSGNIPKEIERLASKLLAAQRIESAFADKVEGYDAELFLLLPRRVWLGCMISRKQSQTLTRNNRLK